MKNLEKFTMANKHMFNYVARGGEDTVYLSMNVKFNDSFPQLLADLERLKNLEQKAKPRRHRAESDYGESDDEFDDPEYEQTLPVLFTDSHEFRVAPHGMNLANSRFSNYRFVLHEVGIRYLLKGTPEPNGASGNVFVMIGSKPLMKWGIEICVKIARSALEEMGGAIGEIKVSRVDLCVDLAGVDVERFQDVFAGGGYVCRARRNNEYEVRDFNPDTHEDFSAHKYGHRKTGVTLGKSNVVVRIYDKLREARNDEEKMELLQQNRFGGVMPEKATRVEFELKREALRNLMTKNLFGICTLDEYLTNRSSIIRYLTTNWLRVYGHFFDRTHTDRLTEKDYLPEWREAVRAFREIDAGKVEQMRAEKKASVPEHRRLKDQIIGCATSIVAQSRRDYEYVEEFLDDFFTQIKAHALLDRDKVTDAIYKKRMFYHSLSPFAASPGAAA
ncbi:hypothetical protein AGMMS49959_15360 [Planctomycetales bacterium]|nr:hypothetical protein AGMMS49959_15360 [Planctomycetales bacterium]